ncbi:MarR family winged helix-turn-helix transcriptional regulator [Streptomyces sp. SCSIO 30461]|uniref:MarR family winged helix-turn-helix transcriptional regulator n=1 Tax=Streptomyces sp. SCSIO 30461 TaxID=3118085 RepID=UPI0030CC53F0
MPAGDVGLDRSGVTRRASRLEEAGLVRRAPDPGDRRVTLLALTAAGEEVVATLCRRLAVHIEAALAGWPADEAAASVRRLRRFVGDGPFTAFEVAHRPADAAHGPVEGEGIRRSVSGRPEQGVEAG